MELFVTHRKSVGWTISTLQSGFVLFFSVMNNSSEQRLRLIERVGALAISTTFFMFCMLGQVASINGIAGIAVAGRLWQEQIFGRFAMPPCCHG